MKETPEKTLDRVINKVRLEYRRAILTEVYKWGNEDCPHGLTTKKRLCPICWNEVIKLGDK